MAESTSARMLRRTGGLFRKAARGLGWALLCGDWRNRAGKRFRWLVREESPGLFGRVEALLEQDLRRDLDCLAPGDHARRIGRAQRACQEVHDLVDPFVERLRSLVGRIEAVSAQEGRAYFEHLERQSPLCVKTRIRALTDPVLSRAAMSRFLTFKDEVVATAIDRAEIRWPQPLARERRFGRAVDSRIVEMPLSFEIGQFRQPGKVLDAGSALNHPYCHQRIDEGPAKVVHFTQSAEREPPLVSGDRYSYSFGDLRDMDYRDATFDRVLCVSTLEHVGKDNSRYFRVAGAEDRPDSHLAAVSEMLRVLKPGGVLFITFPYGRYEDRGWYQVFDQPMVEQLIRHAAPHECEARYYYSDGCWFSGPASWYESAKPGEIADAVAAVLIRKS